MACLKISAILWLSMPLAAIAQPRTAGEIKAKADAELRKLVNKDIFNHCIFNESSYYGYKDSKGELQWGDLKEGVLKGKPVKTLVYYTVDYKYSKCRVYDSIWGRVFLELDSSWTLTNKPNLNFIPDFMMKGEPCKFISKKDALQIGINNGKKTDPHTYGGLSYIEDTKQFVWSFFHMPTYEEMPPTPSDLSKMPPPDIKQMLDWEIYVDAETGTLLDSHAILTMHRGAYITMSDDD
jgi:hypothetical protein